MQSTVLFECTVERKHFFRDKKYYLQLDSLRMTLSEKRNHLNPKYILPLNMDKIFNWIIIKNQIVGFILAYQQKMKQFFGDHLIMLQLKEKMGILVCYEKIERFYKSEEVIESGSFGEVAREVCRFSHKVVAIKSIKIENNQTPTIKNEIEILKQLKFCDQILQIKEVFKDEQRFYIVTEYLHGNSLKDLLENKQKPLSITESLIIIKQVLKGVKFIHKAGILHRDLKPANIMYHNGIVKIIDFGLACFNGKQLEQFPNCGTTGYSAPEVINVWNKKQPYDYKADLFSVGCILYKLLTLDSVFQSDNQKDTFQQNKQCNINIKEKGAIYDFIKLLLKAEPSERLDCNQALEAVQALQDYKHFDVSLWYNSKFRYYGKSNCDFDLEEKPSFTRQFSLVLEEKEKEKAKIKRY